MARIYRSRARSAQIRAYHDLDEYEYDPSQPYSVTVHMDEAERFSGLLDASGNELWSREERAPCGFMRDAADRAG